MIALLLLFRHCYISSTLPTASLRVPSSTFLSVSNLFRLPLSPLSFSKHQREARFHPGATKAGATGAPGIAETVRGVVKTLQAEAQCAPASVRSRVSIRRVSDLVVSLGFLQVGFVIVM